MPHCSGHSLTERGLYRARRSSLILTDIIARPLFCPYYTTSAKYGTNWVLLRKSVVLLAEEYLRKGLPQKSRSEFYGKRSSEHRSKAARNAAACIICSAATKRRGTLLAEIIFESKRNVNLLGSSRGGEQAHSCEEPGGLFAACELGNGTWSVPFPDRARALPREKGLVDFNKRYRPRTYLSLKSLSPKYRAN